jgi:hypothetical protein
VELGFQCDSPPHPDICHCAMGDQAGQEREKGLEGQECRPRGAETGLDCSIVYCTLTKEVPLDGRMIEFTGCYSFLADSESRSCV